MKSESELDVTTLLNRGAQQTRDALNEIGEILDGYGTIISEQLESLICATNRVAKAIEIR